MLLVERVVAWDAQHAVVAATPQADAWYAEDGAMPSWIGIELNPDYASLVEKRLADWRTKNNKE